MNERSGLSLLERWTGDEIAAMASRLTRFGWPYKQNAEAVVRQVIEEQERLRPNHPGAVDALRMAEVELDGRDDFDPDRRVLVLRAVREAIAATGGSRR